MKIDPLFQFHKLNEKGIEEAIAITEAFTVLKSNLDEICPGSREYSIAKTKLEEAAFYSKKAVANNPRLQEGYVEPPIEPDQTVARA